MKKENVLSFLAGVAIALVLVILMGFANKKEEVVNWELLTNDYVNYCTYNEIKGFIGYEVQDGVFITKQNFDTLNIEIITK